MTTASIYCRKCSAVQERPVRFRHGGRQATHIEHGVARLFRSVLRSVHDFHKSGRFQESLDKRLSRLPHTLSIARGPYFRKHFHQLLLLTIDSSSAKDALLGRAPGQLDLEYPNF
jgi:hypothetical protein